MPLSWGDGGKMTAIWMARSGHDFEQEKSCFEENRIFLPIPLIQDTDFTEMETYGEIRKLIEEVTRRESPSTL